MKQIISDSIGTFIIVSLAYIASYTVTIGLILPVQGMIFPNSTVAGILFLPHGIIILAAYYYGWKALPLLLPSVYLMWYIDVYGNGILLDPIQSIISVVCSLIAVQLASRAFKGILEKEWKLLLFSGVIGSVSSSVITNYILNMSFLNITVFQFIIGGISGQIILMVMLIYLFKFSRMVRN